MFKNLVLIGVAMLFATNLFAQKNLIVGNYSVENNLQDKNGNVPNGSMRSVADFVIKTNLLYDLTTTMNLGVEFGLSNQFTLDLSGSYNPWEFSDNRKMKLWMAQPELRWWTCRRFSGHFWGFHIHGGQFNFGGMLPWGFRTGKMFGKIENKEILTHRYQGSFVGAGIGYGFHWLLGKRWGLEAEIGFGYTRLFYDKYRCIKCAKKIDTGSIDFLGPTKAAVSLVYVIK